MLGKTHGVWAVVLCAALSGCVAPPKTLYHWGAYQGDVYEYLKGDGKGYPEQIADLEQEVEKARAANQPLPPGFRAHLGMLYGQVGNYDKMMAAFEQEKLQFPESAAFMDFLLKNKNQTIAAGEAK